MFGRKKKEEPADDAAADAPAEEAKPAPKPASPGDPKKVNIAAKNALLKAYYASQGRSPEDIAKLLAEKEAEEQTAPPEEKPAPAGSIDDLQAQVKEIGKLVGDTILNMENQITALQQAGPGEGGGGDAGIDERFEDHQQQIKTIFENQQNMYTGVTEMQTAISELKEAMGALPAAPQEDHVAGQRIHDLEELTQGLKRQLEEMTAKVDMEHAAIAKMREKTGGGAKAEGSTLQEIERRVADQLRVTSETMDEKNADLRAVVESMPGDIQKLGREVGQLGETMSRQRTELEERMKKIESKTSEISESASKEPSVAEQPDVKAEFLAALDDCIARISQEAGESQGA